MGIVTILPTNLKGVVNGHVQEIKLHGYGRLIGII